MVKKLVLFVAVSLLVASAAAADLCDRSGDNLSWLFDVNLGAPAFADGASANDQSANAVAATAAAADGSEGEPEFAAFCEATCETGTVSCTGSVCSAFNRNCPNERGHVTCDGNTTWCPTVCEDPGCTIAECRAPCREPGCFAYCVDAQTCECDVICF